MKIECYDLGRRLAARPSTTVERQGFVSLIKYESTRNTV